MAKIKVPSPVIDEAVKETAKAEKQKQLEKEKKVRDRYFRWLEMKRARQHHISYGLNTTK